MPEIIKPVFTVDELNEAKTGIRMGLDADKLKPGPTFIEQPTNPFKKAAIVAKEQFDGTAKKRHNHEKINKFACANFYVGTNEIYFSLRYSAKNVMSPLAKSTLNKYEQLLGYYLQASGWANIRQDKYNRAFIVKLNDPVNLDNFLRLAPFIGFDSRSPLPDEDDIKRAKSIIRGMERKKQLIEKKASRETR